MAQTCKSFNRSIWSLITTLDDYDAQRIEESTKLEKFNNLESISTINKVKILRSLTTLQKLRVNVEDAQEMGEFIQAVQLLTNLRELGVKYPREFSETMPDLLDNHYRLTKLEFCAENPQQLGK